MAKSRLETIKKERLEKVKKLRDLGVDPYPPKFDKSHSCAQVVKSLGKKVKTAGRIMAVRGHGRIAFYDLTDSTGKVQLWFQENSLGKQKFKTLRLLDVGDFIGIEGMVVRTKSGEITIDVSDFEILSKTLRALPEKRHGLKDEESRFRKRYLELATNPEIREMFVKKSLFWKTIRDFMIKQKFLEVETPVLENVTGGADANPFVTHHDALDIDVYLRISMGELWQKRLLVGGFEKTFEIGRQFRNEGISYEHLQDYTQMEFYWAYANYQDGMNLVEKLYKEVARKVFGTTKFTIGKFKIDLGGKWQKIDYVSAIKKELGLDVLEATDKDILAKLKELKIDYDKTDSRGRLIDRLWKKIRLGVAGPAFLVDHPVEVSPLAKRKPADSKKVERYQVILAGSEMGNGYSELNDPQDQEARFKEQAKIRDEGDKEAQMHDQDFVEALEYGMPPATGFGVSERLFSFLMNKPARECVVFPLLRPKGVKK